MKVPAHVQAHLSEERQEQVGEVGAHVEADGSVEGELRVDHQAGARRAHERAGVQVAVEIRLLGAHELVFECGDGELGGKVLAQLAHQIIQERVAFVVVRHAVRLHEDYLQVDSTRGL